MYNLNRITLLGCRVCGYSILPKSEKLLHFKHFDTVFREQITAVHSYKIQCDNTIDVSNVELLN